jgi:PadR family transcriptional regulator PadR
MSSKAKSRPQLLQGTLDLIVLQTLASLGELHAYAISTRLQQVSEDGLTLNQGTLYPALIRLEQEGWISGKWGKTENNRDAKFYSITKAGGAELSRETAEWRRLSGFVNKLLKEAL